MGSGPLSQVSLSLLACTNPLCPPLPPPHPLSTIPQHQRSASTSKEKKEKKQKKRKEKKQKKNSYMKFSQPKKLPAALDPTLLMSSDPESLQGAMLQFTLCIVSSQHQKCVSVEVAVHTHEYMWYRSYVSVSESV